MCTSVLLTLEQLMYNQFNPNKKHEAKSSDQRDSFDEMREIAPQICIFLKEWITIMSHNSMNDVCGLEIKMSFMQIIILCLEIPGALKELESVLMTYFEVQLHRVNDGIESIIEEIMTLVTLEKYLSVGGRRVMVDFIQFGRCYDLLQALYSSNQRLGPLIEHLLVVLSQTDRDKLSKDFPKLFGKPLRLDQKELAS